MLAMTNVVDNIDSPVPERRALEASFARARWLATAAIGVLTLLGGFHPAATATAVLALAAGNLGVRYFNARPGDLGSQRRLGVAATTLDATVVLGLALAAPPEAVNVTYGALLVVIAEAAMRFAPVKALLGAALLVAGLASTMALRTVIRSETFDPALLAVLGVLVLLAGTMIGSVVREIYRQSVGSATASETPRASVPSMPEEAMALLTPRERQVLSLIAQGYSNTRIAAALVVEQKTVKNHINNIYGKLQLNSRYEAITHMLGQREAGVARGDN